MNWSRPFPACSEVALLTGGGDRPYALGLATSLAAEGVHLDFIGSDDLQAPEVCADPRIRFLNLRGDQRPDVPTGAKVWRVIAYYARLIRYVTATRTPVLHILWNNKVEWFDRTLLQLLYRALGKRVVLTLHNVNREARDGRDSSLNRLTLRCQYHLSDHLFVHTTKMMDELQREYGVPPEKISVIPFGINSTVPESELTTTDARRRLGLSERDKVVLFFGNIAPYKGVEYLVEAFAAVTARLPDLRLVIAGRPKGEESYWRDIEQRIDRSPLRDRIIRRIEYVPDAETEIYFKAADVLALPYVHIFQSGVLFLAYHFGLPVIATDVGSLKEDIQEGMTGLMCAPGDGAALASAIERYFADPLYSELPDRRASIRAIGHALYSWTTVAKTTTEVYRRVVHARDRMPDAACS